VSDRPGVVLVRLLEVHIRRVGYFVSRLIYYVGEVFRDVAFS